jgi:hypothetical protein
VRNVGGVAREFQLLYHVNYGSPLLEAGGRFRAAVGEITPANAYSAKHVGLMEVYQAPTPGFAEQVYFMTLRPDRTGSTSVLLHNAAGNRGVSMRFDSQALPCFTLWKHTGAIADGYVTGLEPGTSFPRFRQAEREAGRVPTLGAGASRRFVIDFAIHADTAEVSEAAGTIASAGRVAQPEVQSTKPGPRPTRRKCC